MLWYNVLAAQILLPALNAQGIRRVETAYPSLGRRLVANCTDSNCEFCAAAYKIEWSIRPVATVQTVTFMEVINTDDGSTSTTTMTDGLSPDEIAELSSSLSLVSVGPHTSSVTGLGIIMTYPTPYVVFQDDYVWSGTVLTDNSCATSTDPIGEVEAPAPTPLPAPAFSTVEAGVTDTAGWHFDLNAVPFDDQLAQYFDDGAIKSCIPNCNDFPDFSNLATTSVEAPPPPQLTVAFVTTCQRSTRGVDGVEKLADCSPVKAPAPAAPTTASGGGGSGGGEDRHTTTDAKGSTVIVAGSAPSGGGGRQTITDERGSTVIVNGGSGGNLYTSINAQGQTIIATGAPAGGSGGAARGQITLTNADGSTIVIQGGSLASPGSGDGITVTDERGSLMVVQGGQTGTLTVGQGGGTELIAGTMTQTSWVPGATISGGDSGSGSAEPTVQNEAVLRRVPSPLIISGSLLLATVVVFVML